MSRALTAEPLDVWRAEGDGGSRPTGQRHGSTNCDWLGKPDLALPTRCPRRRAAPRLNPSSATDSLAREGSFMHVTEVMVNGPRRRVRGARGAHRARPAKHESLRMPPWDEDGA